MFENRGSQSNVTVRGNPDLQPETDISYQAAMQHLFSRDLSGQFAVFFRDIFGLISVRQAVDAQTGLLVPVYVNQDYASARGFEASLTKRFSHRKSPNAIIKGPRDRQIASQKLKFILQCDRIAHAHQLLCFVAIGHANINKQIMDLGRFGLLLFFHQVRRDIANDAFD